MLMIMIEKTREELFSLLLRGTKGGRNVNCVLDLDWKLTGIPSPSNFNFNFYYFNLRIRLRRLGCGPQHWRTPLLERVRRIGCGTSSWILPSLISPMFAGDPSRSRRRALLAVAREIAGVRRRNRVSDRI